MSTAAAVTPSTGGADDSPLRHPPPRAWLRALEEMAPDCVLIEGPPEADGIIAAATHALMEPPVALLVYCTDQPQLASFYPFAAFSPEWQAVRFALERKSSLRFIDLPQTHDLALRQAREAADAAARAAGADPDISLDPLDWLGRAAGYGDGESWWNQMVEERRASDSGGLFGAIQEAMTVVRAEVPRRLSALDQEREALREAHMRKCIRQAQKDGFTNIAVVCGAWHVPALAELPPAKADNDLLKGLPKVKVGATWAPWTYGRLATSSGYGAGVAAPGWYEYLWSSGAAPASARAIGWIARVARLLREADIDCSPAHVIETARLADALAAMRERPAPGLDELLEAARTVICMGNDAPLTLIRAKLIVGERLGRVPPDVPTVPSQQDLERRVRSLRLKQEAFVRDLDLDLREPNDLARSHLLHGLNLIGIGWGSVRASGRGARGTFHELWHLQWQPEFAVALIEASRWGATIVDAATACAIDQAARADSLPPLALLVDRVLLANLPAAVEPVTQALHNQAALAGDTAQLLDALPPLANIFRYGSVRNTDAALVAQVVDGLVSRAAIGLAGACASLDDDAAAAMRERIVAAHQAIKLIGNAAHLAAWMPALACLAMPGVTHGLLTGLAARLLFDEKAEDFETTERRVSQALSVGNDPLPAAAWLEGFLHQSGMVLLHDDPLWQTVDTWLSHLSEAHFIHVLPLVRRTFSTFPSNERQQLGARAMRAAGGRGAAGAGTGLGVAQGLGWDEARARLPLPLLRTILGITS